MGDRFFESFKSADPSLFRREIEDVLSRFSPTRSFAAREQSDDSSANRGGGSQTLSRSPLFTEKPLFILDPPRQAPPVIGRFEIEQEFEGTVIAMDADGETFTARLVDVSGAGPDEEAEFSLREITDDSHLVVPGAIFSWIIGLQWRKRQSIRVSEIRFRRSSPFSKRAIARAEARAQELSELLAAQNAVGLQPSAQ